MRRCLVAPGHGGAESSPCEDEARQTRAESADLRREGRAAEIASPFRSLAPLSTINLTTMSSFKHLPLGQHAAPDSMDTIPMQDYATRDGRDYSYADLSTSTKHDILNPTPP